MLVIGQLKGQLSCYACGCGQNVSCAHAVVPHFGISTKRRPKTEDRRPKTEDRRPKTEKTKTLIFLPE